MSDVNVVYLSDRTYSMCSGSQGESNKMTPEFIGRMVYSLTSHLLNFAGTITRPVVLRS